MILPVAAECDMPWQVLFIRRRYTVMLFANNHLCNHYSLLCIFPEHLLFKTRPLHNCFVQENRDRSKLCSREKAVVCTDRTHQAFHKYVTIISTNYVICTFNEHFIIASMSSPFKKLKKLVLSGRESLLSRRPFLTTS